MFVQAHHMAVYAVKWNHFHPKTFISCSADWTVKVWDHTYQYVFYISHLHHRVRENNRMHMLLNHKNMVAEEKN